MKQEVKKQKYLIDREKYDFLIIIILFITISILENQFS